MKRQAHEHQTIRIWIETQQRLKLLSALTHESMVEALDRLVEQELQKVQGKEYKPREHEDL
jgi:predicted DNA-binding protein